MHGSQFMRVTILYILVLLSGCIEQHTKKIELSSVMINWSVPTKMDDESALNQKDIAAYYIYWGTNSDKLSYSIKLPANSNSYILTGLESGRYFFSVAIETSKGERSRLSEVVQKFIQ
jgi:hypothetical protein